MYGSKAIKNPILLNILTTMLLPLTRMCPTGGPSTRDVCDKRTSEDIKYHLGGVSHCSLKYE